MQTKTDEGLTVTEHHRNIHEVMYDASGGGQLPILIISDVHYDSVECDREMLDRHMRWAHENNALVIVNGDWYDLMQGRYDPRGTKGAIRPEYVGGNYLDLVIADSVEYLAKWDVTYIMGQGNHETNIRKRLETDVLDRTVGTLRMAGKSAWLSGYSGWVVIRARHGKGANKHHAQTYRLHHHHGMGGNAPRSKGVLRVDIQQMQYPDADMIIRGHDHNKWHMPITVSRLVERAMVIEKRTVHHLQTGSYKMAGDGYAGWETEKGFAEPRLGGWMVTLSNTVQGEGDRKRKKIKVTVAEAS